jgi:hypothetical protein
MSNLIDALVEIELPDSEAFLKVKETLTRIGVASRKDNTLYQSCHILHKQGKYYITHFKELFALDGKPTDFSENDVSRRNTIANLLDEWGLIRVLNQKKTADPVAPISQIKVIAFKDKDNWILQSKYNIGK